MNMNAKPLISVLTVACAMACNSAVLAADFDSGAISGIGARNIGSAAMSGRIAALDARVDNGKVLLYVGAASGGVWKSTDGGTTFDPVFDKQPVQSIGEVAIDPSNSQIVWVGTGESWVRNSVSVGNGVYKTTDGGDSWTHMGLPNSERISRIVIDPKDSNTVYVCVPGKLWSDSTDRGLYKTTDGGANWALVLKGPNASTGCADVDMDPINNRRLIASTWDFRRKGWTFRSGGDGPEAFSGSGIFVSEDAGKTWKALDEKSNQGLPPKPWGRSAVTIAPSDPSVVYAVIEGTRSALFRSSDGGKTWEERDRSQSMVWRPFYFSRLIVDPINPERLFKPNLNLIVSDDGGKSFSGSGGGAHGDWHDLWINPSNTKHLIGGDDGGLWISHDGGNRWWKGNNLPISQFYHVSVDDLDPYQVYGGLQDNSSWVGQSQYPGGINNSEWENMYGGDGFWMFSDPADPDYLYAEYQGGNIARINRKTHEIRDIQPKPNYGEKLRFNWNTPIHLSPNEKGTIYIAAQYLFRSRNHGQSWERISPDLTTNDNAKQQQELSGGITVDNSSAEMHTTIYSISESPRDGQTIWVGTDDGNVQLTRDGGKTWNNVVGNIKGLPKASWVSWIEASRHDAATAYAAFDRHTFGDMSPYVYVTRDYGKTWRRIVGPEQGVRGYAHVVREDTVRSDLLFVGTEFGLWVSIDGGAKWAEYKGLGFPSVAVRDLVVHPREHDLVLGTHGRGIWIIDDITPWRGLTDETMSAEVAFLPTRSTQQRFNAFGGWANGDAVFTGANPPNAAMITYYQQTRHLFGDLKLEILDASGKVVDTLTASKRKGINRVAWSMRMKPPRVPRAAQLAFNASQGPRVVPGVYTVRLTKNKQVYETKIEIGLDARAKYSVADRQAQFDAAMKVHGMFNQLSAMTDQINFLRMMVAQYLGGLPEKDALRGKLAAFDAQLDGVRKKIVATKEGGAITGEERLREHMDTLYGSIMSNEGRPADYQLARIESIGREMGDVVTELQTLLGKEVPTLNEALTKKGLPPIGPPGGGR
jgi:photosystem II stability/assembly factor-like uncharacterized protein